VFVSKRGVVEGGVRLANAQKGVLVSPVFVRVMRETGGFVRRSQLRLGVSLRKTEDGECLFA
jgi:hypothetical protein